MNLRDVSVTPMHIAFEAVKSVVNDHGIQTCGSELVGLVPLSAMLESADGMLLRIAMTKKNWSMQQSKGLVLIILENLTPISEY